jgi:hypothetical protein
MLLGAAIAAGASSATAQSVFYDTPNSTQYLEIKSWGLKYVAFNQTGVPASGAATFTFSTPAMNSPLFSPLRAVNSVVGLATGMGECDTEDVKTFDGALTESAAMYLADGEVATSLDDTNATLAHLEAAVASSAQLGVEGNQLVSVGLTPALTTTSPGAAQYGVGATSTMTWLAELSNNAPVWAASRNFANEHRKVLTGTPTEVSVFGDSVRSWVASKGLDITVYEARANFGRYGSLPIFVGSFISVDEVGYVLIDPINGNVDGPFDMASPINPTALLNSHSEFSGGGVVVADVLTGKCMPMAAGWKTTPKPGTFPRPAIVPPTVPVWPVWPPGTNVPVCKVPPVAGCYPFNPNPTRPGYFGDYSCVTKGAVCVCTSYGQETDTVPGAPWIEVRRTCKIPGGCLPGPFGAPPGTPYGPPGNGTCTTEYFY